MCNCAHVNILGLILQYFYKTSSNLFVVPRKDPLSESVKKMVMNTEKAKIG